MLILENSQASLLVEACAVSSISDGEDLGLPTVVEPSVQGPEEHVGLCSQASCHLHKIRIYPHFTVGRT